MRLPLLKKLAAVLLLAGLGLPYGCDARPITVLWTSWSDPGTLFALGIPVLAALAYGLHSLLPPLARFHERHGAGLHGILDRKSTRLNSSHTVISYAVFCLKKKKKQKTLKYYTKKL